MPFVFNRRLGSSLAGLSAGVYMGTGEVGTVFDCSFRVQWWDFSRLLPPLDLSSENPYVAEIDGTCTIKWESSVNCLRLKGRIHRANNNNGF